MKNILTKVIRNMQSSNRGKCADVLGSDRALAELTQVWEHNAGDFHLISAYLTNEFIVTGNRSSENVEIYKKALGDLLKFLDETTKDYYNILEKNN